MSSVLTAVPNRGWFKPKFILMFAIATYRSHKVSQSEQAPITTNKLRGSIAQFRAI